MASQLDEPVYAKTGMAAMFHDLRCWSRDNLRYAADLLLPPICVFCHEPVAAHGGLCASCWQGVEFITPPICDRLGLPLGYGGDSEIQLSAMAVRHPPVFRRARAAVRFSGVMRHLIHGFKYADRHEASAMFARLMAAAGTDLIRDADILIPVPLHRRKLFARRFNQAAILARKLSELTGVPASMTALQRVKPTSSQVGLSREARSVNVTAAFRLAFGADHIKGASVILIDDVITTGATLNACARTLLNAGAAHVDCLSVAMTAGFDGTD